MASAVGSLGLGTSLAGGLLSAFGAEKSGQSQQQIYNYQSQVAKINADIARQNATWALNQGDAQALNQGLKAGQQFGQIRASQGASGLDVNSGSAVDVQRSQRTLTSMDLTQIKTNASKTAYDYLVKANAEENQASLYTAAGKNAKTAGDIGAFSSLLGTASSVSSKWLQGNTAGLWGGSDNSQVKLYGPDQTVTGYA